MDIKLSFIEKNIDKSLLDSIRNGGSKLGRQIRTKSIENMSILSNQINSFQQILSTRDTLLSKCSSVSQGLCETLNSDNKKQKRARCISKNNSKSRFSGCEKDFYISSFVCGTEPSGASSHQDTTKINTTLRMR